MSEATVCLLMDRFVPWWCNNSITCIYINSSFLCFFFVTRLIKMHGLYCSTQSIDLCMLIFKVMEFYFSCSFLCHLKNCVLWIQ
jgi:hypothetical protein